MVLQTSRALLLLIIAIILFSLYLPTVLAYTECRGSNCTDPYGNKIITLGSVEQLVVDLSAWIVRVSALIAVGYIVWSGVVYMTGGDSDRVKKAQAMMKNGIVGLLIIFGVGVIIATIRFVAVGGVFDPTFWF